MPQGGFYDTDARARQEKALKDQAFLETRRVEDMKKLLKLPEFRRLCWDLWSEVGIFRDGFSQNAMVMAREAGAKAVGLGFLAKVNDADVNAFAQIQREAISEQKAREAAEKKPKEGN